LTAILLIVGLWFRWRASEGRKGTPFVVSRIPGKLITGGYSGWVGFRFTVGLAPLTLTELGRFVVNENSNTHTLKLVDAQTGADVPGSAVEVSTQGRSPGSMAYAPMKSRITLQAGSSYYLVSSESVSNNRGDFFHNYDSRVETNNVASVDNAVCLEGGKWKDYGQTNNSFGPIDFRYVISQEH
jgi:hypothetical protein